MKSTTFLLLLLSFSTFGWLACDSSSVTANEETTAENSLAELEALVSTAAKNTESTTDFSAFANRTEHPCYNPDSAAVRHEAKATMVKFQAEIAALALENWPENTLLTRVNNLELRQLERLMSFQEATGIETDVLALPVGVYNNDRLDALYAQLSAQIAESEILAVKAIGYTQELLISLNFNRREAMRANIDDLRTRLENGEATACDSARVANFRDRAEQLKQDGTGNRRSTQRSATVGQKGDKKGRLGAPILLKYVVKYLENEGITYEPQLIDSEVFIRIMNAKPNGQKPTNGTKSRTGQGRRG